MINELDQVVLQADLPDHGLQQGDIGTVVLIHQGGAGYEVEFAALNGETVAVVSLAASQILSHRSPRNRTRPRNRASSCMMMRGAERDLIQRIHAEEDKYIL